MNRADLTTPLEELPPDYEAALKAASLVYGDFKDDPQSHYYEAEGLTPDSTWKRITEEAARVSVIVIEQAHSGELLEAEDFAAIHDAIFRPIFGEATLGLRGYHDQVTFGIVRGPRDAALCGTQQGVSPKSLGGQLRKTAEDFAKEVAQIERLSALGGDLPILTATHAVSKLYCRTLAIHPFLDGNGRTAHPVMAFGLVRCGLPAISIPETDEFNWCLGQGMRKKNRNFEPMAENLAGIIRASAGA